MTTTDRLGTIGVMQINRLALAIACLTSLTGCSCRVDVHIRGSTRGPVTFYVDGRGMQHVHVTERDFSGGWADVWDVRGEAGEREVVYGQTPAGFSAVTPPRPLHPRGIYQLDITCEKPLLGPSCSGSTLFAFTPGGAVKTCTTVDACSAIIGG